MIDLAEYSKYIHSRSEYLLKITDQCRNILKYFPIAAEARDYVDSRVSKSDQEKFKFGYFPPNDHLHLLTKTTGVEPLKKTKILYERNIADSNYIAKMQETILTNHNIVMPYKDLYGNIISIVGRTMLGKEDYKRLGIGKYKNTPFSKNLHLFGLSDAREAILASGFVIVVEGQIDLITCHRYGIFNVVALGGSAFNKYHFQLLLRYTDQICLLLDSDNAGRTAVEKIIKSFGSKAKFFDLHLPDGYTDVDQCLSKGNNSHIFDTIRF